MNPHLRHFNTPDNDGSNYSSAILVGGLIFTAGQLGISPSGDPTSFEDQAKRALETLISVVEAMGGSQDTIVKINGYIADVAFFPTYHEVYRSVFRTSPRPVRTTVQVGRFEAPILVEVDGIATVASSGPSVCLDHGSAATSRGFAG